MGDSGEDRRVYSREKHRVPCELRVGNDQYKGVVLDVSARGLFVQTNAPLPNGTQVRVTLLPPGRQPFEVTARVARARKAIRAVSPVINPGLGLQIQAAPECYFQLVRDINE